uniref:Scm-like with four mbt domains 1 n=1 Tax=Strongyloides venezuelensis TaxID=75913 RepID=A0A0K0FSS8_STRVS
MEDENMLLGDTADEIAVKEAKKGMELQKGGNQKVPQLTGDIKDSIDGSEKLPTVKNSSTIIKKGRSDEGKSEEVKKQPKVVFSFKELIKAMYDGQVQALLANHDLQGVPHRGIMVKNMCVPLIALLSNKQIKNGKIVDREVVNIPSGRRLVPNVGVIKAYEFNQHESMVKMLTSKNWELIEFNAFTEGQQPLFKNVSTKVLIINLRTLCMNMKFVACKIKNCKCKFRTVLGIQNKPYVFKCPTSCIDEPATLAYADLPDIWRFD